jgi:hypothetical protein
LEPKEALSLSEMGRFQDGLVFVLIYVCCVCACDYRIARVVTVVIIRISNFENFYD